jgi:hypothetical protein
MSAFVSTIKCRLFDCAGIPDSRNARVIACQPMAYANRRSNGTMLLAAGGRMKA